MDPDTIIQILGNKYNPEILGATGEPKSVKDLADELEIPTSTCYRRIEELMDVNLIEHHDRVLSDEHRRISVYRRNVDAIRVDFAENSYNVELEERTELQNKLDEIWSDLSPNP